MINVAIIGFGSSGRYLQAPFFEANTNFNLKIILSNTQNPQQYYPNVKVVTTVDAILADESIDLVSICSPNHTHFNYAKQALLAGKNVLVEKPFTATVQEAVELIALAHKQQKLLTVFQNRRFDSDFITVKKLIDESRLGEILNFEIHYNRFRPTLNPKKWKETNSAGSGIIYDLGAHIIDQAIVLFGTPLKVTGQCFSQRPHSLIDDAFDIRLDYGRLKVTLRSSLMVRGESPRYIIHGTNGSFIKYGLDVQEDHLKSGMMPQDENFGKEPAANDGIFYTEKNNTPIQEKISSSHGRWALLFEDLHTAITNKTQPSIKLDQVLQQIKIIEAVKNSAF